MMKKLALVLLASFLALPVLAADYKFIVVSHGQQNDPFWSVAKNGVDTAAEDMNVEVQYRAPATFDMVEMAKLIDNAVASRPDGLVVTLPDADALGRSIRRAVRRGVPVISMNSGSDVYEELGVMAHVGQTEYEAGLGGGKRMRAAGVRKAICVNHEVGNVALDLRCQGFKDGMDGNVEVVDTGGNDPTAVVNAVTAKLKSDPTIEGILTLGPLSGEPALGALRNMRKAGEVKLASFDLSADMLRAVDGGDMLFLIDQQQYLQGYLPIVMLTQYQRWGTMPAGVVMTGPGFVTQDNAADVISAARRGYR